MALSFFLIILITAGGFALTYVFADDEPFLWRVSAGNVAGCAIFGTIEFLLACFFGLSVPTVILSLLVTMGPLVLFLRKDRRHSLHLDWQRAKGKLQGANLPKFLAFAYYVFFFVLFWLFFERAMIETAEGIFTGGSHNLGDLPFHLGAIFSFTDGNNFPPENPSFAGARFSYPFIADLLTASFMKLGAGVKEAMFVQNFSWALALLVLLDRFVARITGERSAGKIAAFLLFFGGGLGFLWFFSDLRAQASGFWEFLWHLPRDYTMNDDFSWGNSLITLFITQRSLLLGMPLTVIALGFLWRAFATEDAEITKKETSRHRGDKRNGSGPTLSASFLVPFLVGLLAGTLPLIHLHSLAVLFVVTAFLFAIRPEKWQIWIGFGLGVCIIAIPELAWSVTGSASKTSEFFGWHFGWDAKNENIIWFWIRNTGTLIPVLIGGILLVWFRKGNADDDKGKQRDATDQKPPIKNLLLFYLPFLFCFIVSNIARLAPWEWDNIKVLIYWFVGSIPFVALAITWAWKKNIAYRILAAIGFTVLIASGALDIWRTVSGQIKMKVFDKDAEQIAERIKKTTPSNAVFLNAPTYNSAIVLSGRRSLMRFPGHLWSHGIAYAEREADVKNIYSGGPQSDDLLRKYGIDYVLISPEEMSSLKANENFFRKFPIVAEVGQYRIFKIR